MFAVRTSAWLQLPPRQPRSLCEPCWNGKGRVSWPALNGRFNCRPPAKQVSPQVLQSDLSQPTIHNDDGEAPRSQTNVWARGLSTLPFAITTCGGSVGKSPASQSASFRPRCITRKAIDGLPRQNPSIALLIRGEILSSKTTTSVGSTIAQSGLRHARHFVLVLNQAADAAAFLFSASNASAREAVGTPLSGSIGSPKRRSRIENNLDAGAKRKPLAYAAIFAAHHDRRVE